MCPFTGEKIKLVIDQQKLDSSARILGHRLDYERLAEVVHRACTSNTEGVRRGRGWMNPCAADAVYVCGGPDSVLDAIADNPGHFDTLILAGFRTGYTDALVSFAEAAFQAHVIDRAEELPPDFGHARVGRVDLLELITVYSQVISPAPRPELVIA